MPTPLEQCDTNIAQIQARIAELTAQLSPDHSIDGESYQTGALLGQLNDALDKQIALRRKLAGPYSVRSYGRARR